MAKHSMKSTVRFVDIANAYTAFRELTGMAFNHNTRERFFEFLGQDITATDFANEETLKKIQWLTGPHAKTMYAIWKAQHDKTVIGE